MSKKRREFIRALGIVGIAGVSGCSETGGLSGGGETSSTTKSPLSRKNFSRYTKWHYDPDVVGMKRYGALGYKATTLREKRDRVPQEVFNSVKDSIQTPRVESYGMDFASVDWATMINPQTSGPWANVYVGSFSDTDIENQLKQEYGSPSTKDGYKIFSKNNESVSFAVKYDATYRRDAIISGSPEAVKQVILRRDDGGMDGYGGPVDVIYQHMNHEGVKYVTLPHEKRTSTKSVAEKGSWLPHVKGQIGFGASVRIRGTEGVLEMVLTFIPGRANVEEAKDELRKLKNGKNSLVTGVESASYSSDESFVKAEMRGSVGAMLSVPFK